MIKEWQVDHLHQFMEVKEKHFLPKVTSRGLQEHKEGKMALEKNFILFVGNGIPRDNVGQKDKVITVAIVEVITLLTNVVNLTR